MQKHFYYQTYTTQTNFQICTLLSYLSLFLKFTCYPAFLLPRRGGRVRVLYVRRWCVVGAGRDPAAALHLFGLLPFSAFLPAFVRPLPESYIVLLCPVPSLYFLSVVCSCLLGLPAAATCLFFLSDFVTSGLGSTWLMAMDAGGMREE